MVDTIFRDWLFRATGAPVAGARTLPDRLSEIINVKDWGALGTSSSDDTAEIQAAIDYAMAQGGGKVFFPQGVYGLSAPLVVGNSVDAPVTLIGTGKNSSGLTRLSGYTGSLYMISSGAEAVDNLARIEGLGGFTVKGTRSGVSFEECNFKIYSTGSMLIAMDLSEATGSLVRACLADGPTNTHSQPDDASPGDIRGCVPDTIAYCLGSCCTVIACNVVGGFEIGYALSGEGSALLGSRCEVLGCGVRVGWGPAGETASYGATVQGHQTERCMWGIDLYNATACFVSGCFVSGAEGLTNAEAITATWSGGTVTVTTTGGAHNIPPGPQILQLNVNPATFKPDIVQATGALNQSLWHVTVPASPNNQFTYSGVTSPGVFVSGTWNWPIEWTLRCRKVYETVIMGLTGANSAFGTVDLDYDGEAEHRNNVFAAFRTSYGWVLPTTRNNLAAWKFIGGVGAPSATGLLLENSTAALTPVGQMVFADLPTGSDIQDGPYEGQEFDITDGNSSAFDATQTGGGSGNYKVRWNGSAWKRVG